MRQRKIINHASQATNWRAVPLKNLTRSKPDLDILKTNGHQPRRRKWLTSPSLPSHFYTSSDIIALTKVSKIRSVTRLDNCVIALIQKTLATCNLSRRKIRIQKSTKETSRSHNTVIYCKLTLALDCHRSLLFGRMTMFWPGPHLNRSIRAGFQHTYALEALSSASTRRLQPGLWFRMSECVIGRLTHDSTFSFVVVSARPILGSPNCLYIHLVWYNWANMFLPRSTLKWSSSSHNQKQGNAGLSVRVIPDHVFAGTKYSWQNCVHNLLLVRVITRFIFPIVLASILSCKTKNQLHDPHAYPPLRSKVLN